MKIVRKELSPVEGQAPGQRYNPDCDCIEVSVDGGVTWTPSPGADPRTNTAYLLPPNTEPDPRCAGAAGMVAYVRASVDTAIDVSTVIGLANGLFAIVVAFLPITILAAVVIAIAEYLIGLGAAALIAAFSEETYDSLLCIFYNNAEADGSITEDGFEAAQADIASQIGDIVVDGVIAALYSSTGFVGWSNAGSQLADPEADCVDCDGWCHLSEFLFGMDSYSIDVGSGGDFGTYTPPFETALYFQVEGGGAYYQGLGIRRGFDNTYVSGIVARGVVTWGNNVSLIPEPRSMILYALSGGVPVLSVSKIPADTPDGAFEIGLPVGQAIDGIAFGVTAGYSDNSVSLEDPGGVLTLNEIEASGLGDNPLGDDNCE